MSPSIFSPDLEILVAVKQRKGFEIQIRLVIRESKIQNKVVEGREKSANF